MTDPIRMTNDDRNRIVETISVAIEDIESYRPVLSGREYAIAVRKLEEASMWLNRGYYKENPTEGEK